MIERKHIGHRVMALMDRMGVAPITRNYHLFYICLANSDPKMRLEVRRLGRYPTQQQLDQLIETYCPDAVDSYMMRRHENAVLTAIDDLAARIQSEQFQLTNFTAAIEKVSAALAKTNEREQLTADLLRKTAKAMEQAGARRAAAGQRTLQRMRSDRSEVDLLRDELVRVRRMANTDALTGLANRRNFDDRLAAAFGKGQDFSLILIDIDHFKSINDQYGHSCGDNVLRSVAGAMVKALRAGSFIARTGGEEFAVLVPTSQDSESIAAGERIRKAVAATRISVGGDEVVVTVSLGAAGAKEFSTASELFEAADLALYRAKNAGRNRLSVYSASLDDSSSGRYRIYG